MNRRPEIPRPVRVAVLDDYLQVALRSADWKALGDAAQVSFFHDHLEDEAAVAARLEPFPIMVVMRERTRFPRSLLERLPNLRLLVTTGRRNCAIDLDAAAARGVLVCGTDTLSHPTVELTWALILTLFRRPAGEAAALRTGRWQTAMGLDLRGRTLGLVGLGRLGGEVATIAQAFGMKVIAWSQNLTDERASEVGAARVTKVELFTQADVVSVHVAYSPRSHGMIGKEELAAMKPTAFLINTARALIIDQQALLSCLRERQIAGAALDVFEHEPLLTRHPYLALDNVLATPHLGYVTEDNYRLMYGQAVEAIGAFLAGRHPALALNYPP